MPTLDASGNIWSENTDAVSKSNSSGTLLGPPGGYPAGIVNVNGLVTDGLDRIWYSNSAVSGIVGAMDNSGNLLTPIGYQAPDGPFQGTPYNDIDPSGNLWLATNNAILVEFVGIAAPVVRPSAPPSPPTPSEHALTHPPRSAKLANTKPCHLDRSEAQRRDLQLSLHSRLWLLGLQHPLPPQPLQLRRKICQPPPPRKPFHHRNLAVAHSLPRTL